MHCSRRPARLVSSVLSAMPRATSARAIWTARRLERTGGRDWGEIRVAGRDAAKARALAEQTGATSVSTFEGAVRGADVVHAATHAPEPVVRLDWLQPGAHVGSVGFNSDGPEVDPAIVRVA